MAANFDDINSDIDSILSRDDIVLQKSLEIAKLTDELRQAKYDIGVLKEKEELQKKLTKEAQDGRAEFKKKFEEEQLAHAQTFAALTKEKAVVEKVMATFKEAKEAFAKRELAISAETTKLIESANAATLKESKAKLAAEYTRDRYKEQIDMSHGKYPPGSNFRY